MRSSSVHIVSDALCEVHLRFGSTIGVCRLHSQIANLERQRPSKDSRLALSLPAGGIVNRSVSRGASSGLTECDGAREPPREAPRPQCKNDTFQVAQGQPAQWQARPREDRPAGARE